MWELAEAIDGMAEACRAFGLPVVGGNVSLYNETRGHDIDPTPVVGVLGMVDELVRRPPGRAARAGRRRSSCSGRGGAGAWPGRAGRGSGAPRAGSCPRSTCPRSRPLAALVRQLVADDVLQGVHDVADGGLALALAEMVAAAEVGRRLTPRTTTSRCSPNRRTGRGRLRRAGRR